MYFRIVIEYDKRLLSRRPIEGFSHPPQALFPTAFEIADKRFSLGQCRYAREE